MDQLRKYGSNSGVTVVDQNVRFKLAEIERLINEEVHVKTVMIDFDDIP